ncbi:MAG: site-2 protease family protein [Dehalococcoidales bacterium]|nr:site-2 protease family protein [Dehalococcoidales bacterium]
MFGNLDALIYIIPAILIAITIHEFSHAFVANWLGDPTAKLLGRVSPNPLRHLDPMGTIMIVFTAIAGFGIGWGKPVPVNPYRLRMGGKTGMAVVSAAGPVSNILTAFLLVLPARLGWISYGYDPLGQVVLYTVAISMGLAVFNLLPLPPLDGFKVALGLLPMAAARGFARLEEYGPAVLLLILFGDWTLHLGILSALLSPLRMVVQGLVFGTLL